jgi:hypothetical protein
MLPRRILHRPQLLRKELVRRPRLRVDAEAEAGEEAVVEERHTRNTPRPIPRQSFAARRFLA